MQIEKILGEIAGVRRSMWGVASVYTSSSPQPPYHQNTSSSSSSSQDKYTKHKYTNTQIQVDCCKGMPVRTSSDLNSKAKSIRTCLSAYHQRSARTDPTLHQRHQSESALTLRCLTRHAGLPANCKLFKREQMLITYIQLVTSLSMV